MEPNTNPRQHLRARRIARTESIPTDVDNFPNDDIELIRFDKRKQAISKAYGKLTSDNIYQIKTHDGQNLLYEVFIFGRGQGNDVMLPNYKVELIKKNQDGTSVIVGSGWRTKKGNGYKITLSSDQKLFGTFFLRRTNEKGKNFF